MFYFYIGPENGWFPIDKLLPTFIENHLGLNN